MTRPGRSNSFEVLIVGGGPAGSTLARVLKQTGIEVAILDKAVFPRDKICAGWVTPAVMEELEIDLEDYAAHNVLQPIHGFRTGRIGRARHAINLECRRLPGRLLLGRSGETLWRGPDGGGPGRQVPARPRRRGVRGLQTGNKERGARSSGGVARPESRALR